MLSIPHIEELIILILFIAVLSRIGVWPSVVRALRELRGEHVEPPAPETKPDVEVCFKMLGISPSASWDEIERAYRQKAKIHHPDHGGDGDTMRALNDAYSLLKRLRGRN
jgi:hypothetical protein